MKRYQNLLLLAAVVVLVAAPLWMVQRPAPGAHGEQIEIFRGADDQARDVIGTIAPGYQPWFKPLLEPASAEISSLLFALQAALGAGFIGYYLGVANTRAKAEKAVQKDARC